MLAHYMQGSKVMLIPGNFYGKREDATDVHSVNQKAAGAGLAIKPNVHLRISGSGR